MRDRRPLLTVTVVLYSSPSSSSSCPKNTHETFLIILTRRLDRQKRESEREREFGVGSRTFFFFRFFVCVCVVVPTTNTPLLYQEDEKTTKKERDLC